MIKIDTQSNKKQNGRRGIFYVETCHKILKFCLLTTLYKELKLVTWQPCGNTLIKGGHYMQSAELRQSNVGIRKNMDGRGKCYRFLVATHIYGKLNWKIF